MGTPSFAVPCLQALIKSGHKVVAVVTQPDRPKGRGKKLTESPVKKTALENGLNIFQPERINKDEGVLTALEKLAPSLIVTAAFGQILSKRVLSIPSLDCINIHTSLLPKYRGAAPINRAIINGEKETGVTVMKMVAVMDAGDIIEQCPIAIDNDEDAEELEARLAGLAVEPLLKVVDSFESNSVKYTPQDESLVTFADKLEKKEGLIDWNAGKEEIHNMVRGLMPWPCAHSFFKKSGSDEKKRIIVKKSLIDAECESNCGKPHGEIIKIGGDGMLVSTKNGAIRLSMLQPEGKRVMEARDYANGHGVKAGDCFSL